MLKKKFKSCFFGLGYSDNTPALIKISLKYPSFLFILFSFILVLVNSVNGAVCGDGTCYTGYDEVDFLLNLSGDTDEDTFSVGASSVYALNNTMFLVKLLSVNRATIKADFKINDTNLTNLAVNDKAIAYGIVLTIKDITVNIDNEELNCSQDCDECNSSLDCDDDNTCTVDTCSGVPKKCSNTDIIGCTTGNFVHIGETFTLGTGLCKLNYEFVSVDENNDSIIIKDEKSSETVSLSYSSGALNDYGKKIVYEVKIINSTLEYELRYNEITDLLYLEGVSEPCPLVDYCTSNWDCDDNNSCTIDSCTGDPLRCKHYRIPYCKSGDGCCPSKCDYTNDDDCLALYECFEDSDCDDNNSCTIDNCTGDPTKCLNKPITICETGDNCCPSNCSYDLDQDCEKPAVCGDNVCEGNETMENCCEDCSCNSGYVCKNNICVTTLCGDDICEGDENKTNCCVDCGCDEGYECVNYSCKKSGIFFAEEIVNKSDKFLTKQDEVLSNDFIFENKSFSKSEKGYLFQYLYKNKDNKKIALEGEINDEGEILYLSMKKERNIFLYIIIVIVITVIALSGTFTAKIVNKKREERQREEHYKKMLQQKYAYQQHHRYRHHHSHPRGSPYQPRSQFNKQFNRPFS